MAPKVAVIFYSTYGHIATMAEAVKAGVAAAGGNATIFQVPETLSAETLEKMHAPAKKDYPEASLETLTEYDAFLFGIPTRFGNMPGQFKAFWDQTGPLWATGKLYGKPAGIFVSTGTQGGGMETTAMTAVTPLVHHGMTFVPMGYTPAFEKITNTDEVHGGSPWGSGTVAGAKAEREVSQLEKDIAEAHGKSFYERISKLV